MPISARFGRPGVIQVSGGSRSSSTGGGSGGLIDIVGLIKGFQDRAKIDDFLEAHKVKNREHMTSEQKAAVASKIQEDLVSKNFADQEETERGGAERALMNLFNKFKQPQREIVDSIDPTPRQRSMIPLSNQRIRQPSPLASPRVNESAEVVGDRGNDVSIKLEKLVNRKKELDFPGEIPISQEDDRQIIQLSPLEAFLKARQGITNQQRGELNTSNFSKTLFDSLVAGPSAGQKPFLSSRLNTVTGKTERGMIDPATGYFTPATAHTDRGKIGRVIVPPTKNITLDNKNSATRKALEYHQGQVNDTIALKDRYQQIQNAFDIDAFTTMGRLQQQFATFKDGKVLIDPGKDFGNTPEGKKFRRIINLMQSARQLFIEERRLSTGVAFSEKEIDDLKKTLINVEDFGPAQVKASVDGALFRLGRRFDLNQNFLKNYRTTDDLFELNKLQDEFVTKSKGLKKFGEDSVKGEDTTPLDKAVSSMAKKYGVN